MKDSTEIGIGARLRSSRRARGLSQADVSAGICSVSYLSLIEAGKRTPDERVLQQLLARLDLVSEDDGDTVGALDPLSAAEVALRLGDVAQAERLLAHAPAIAQAVLLRALVHEFRGDNDAAIELLTQIIDDSSTSAHVAIRAQIALCRCLFDAGQIESARNVGENALRLMTQGSDDWQGEIPELRATLATVYCESGDLFRARQLTASTFQGIETPWQAATREWARALVHNSAGDFARAGEHARNGLRRLRELDKPRSEANLLHTAVWVELQSGTYEATKCRDDLEAAEVTLRGMHADVELAMCLSTRAEFESIEGKAELAAILIADALELLPDDVAGIRARILVGAATCAFRANSFEDSRQRLLEARQLLESSGANRGAAICWRQMGAIYEELGEADLALACVKAASDLVGLGAHVLQPVRAGSR